MRKLVITGFVLLMILTGCNREQEAQRREQVNQYETFYRSLLNEDRFQTSSRNFKITAEIDEVDGKYEYYITIEDPKIAMYDVQVMVVEDKVPFSSSNIMMPNAGIFESASTLIPNQARRDKGFMSGILLNHSDLTSPTVSLRILVSWKNYTNLETFKEVFEFNLTYQPPAEETQG